MVHADSALLPDSIASKADFYAHVSASLAALLQGQRAWVTNLSNASSLLHHSLNSWRELKRDASDPTKSKAINWTGFYLLSGLFPATPSQPDLLKVKGKKVPTIVLGPFHGMPACQAIPSVPGKGVCADGSAKLPPTSVRVPRTDDYPGHIACDSLSKSELVIPLVVPLARLSASEKVQQARKAGENAEQEDSVTAWSGRGDGDEIIVGLLDIDCVEEDGFDEEDQKALEGIVKIIVDSCDW